MAENEPTPSRPYMPGYGTLGPAEGTGLLSWQWALEELTRSHDYWLATISPDGWPHVMPVWAVWSGGAVWFSSSNGSRKARNLAQRPRVTITTDDALNPVVVQGEVERMTSDDSIGRFVAVVNAKYDTSYGLDFFSDSSCFRLTPQWVFGLRSADFAGSPTRWRWPTRN